MTGFKNLMRYCNNIAEYEQAKTEGTVTDDVLVIVLEDKIAYFKGQTFDWDKDLSAYATKDEVIENEEVTAAAINDLKDRLGDFSADILDEYATKEELQNEISSLTEEVVLNEEITAAAINDLNDRVNDVYPNVAEIYSTKTEMASGFTELTEEVVTNEEVTASALNELNDRVSSCATMSDLDSKQDILVSGSTIKTVNGNSLLGSGDITIEGGGGGISIQSLSPIFIDTFVLIAVLQPDVFVALNNFVKTGDFSPTTWPDIKAEFATLDEALAEVLDEIVLAMFAYNSNMHAKLVEYIERDEATFVLCDMSITDKIMAEDSQFVSYGMLATLYGTKTAEAEYNVKISPYKDSTDSVLPTFQLLPNGGLILDVTTQEDIYASNAVLYVPADDSIILSDANIQNNAAIHNALASGGTNELHKALIIRYVDNIGSYWVSTASKVLYTAATNNADATSPILFVYLDNVTFKQALVSSDGTTTVTTLATLATL